MLMKCNIVGFKKIDFVDKESGEIVKGIRVFYNYDNPNHVEVGLSVGMEFLPESIIKKYPDLNTVSIGDTLLLDYTKGNDKQRSQLLSAELIKPVAPSQPVDRKSGFLGK